MTDIRDPAGFYALYDAVAQRLHELPAATRRGRVGIAGLADLPRFPEGVVAHGAYETLRRALPDAEFVNATLGDDAPLLVFRSRVGSRHQRMSEWRLESDAVLMVKPYVSLGDPHRDVVEDSVGWGDTVVVTKDGARRLGSARVRHPTGSRPPRPRVPAGASPARPPDRAMA